MPKVNLPASEPIYAAAERFVEQALRRDGSLFTPGRAIWTLANLDDLYQRLVVGLDEGEGNFEAKLYKQLDGATSEVYQLAAELIYVHLLVVDDISYQTKHDLVARVLEWSSEPVQMRYREALQRGLAKAGVAYKIHRAFQIGFLLSFVRAWKQQPTREQARLLEDPWAFKAFLFGLPMRTGYAQREAILHLVHPETFEAIVSGKSKSYFVGKYAEYAEHPDDDRDRMLLAIRRGYEQKHGPFNSFFDLDRLPPPDPSPLPRSLGDKLLSYVRLVTHLDGSSYTPQQIVDRLGQISPPIANLTAAPNAETLARDLMLLRLLEPLGNGAYRRWSHLADVTEAHLLRYVALTLLVPNGQGGYQLPILRAPLDGELHPEAEWPLGHALLAWYQEAGLVEAEQGQWRARSDALAPLPGTTPTAQAVNTFLEHLMRVQTSRRELPPLADEGLTLLDPTTLEQRIAEIQRELLIDRMTILRVYRALIAGQHVILSGPPGTGKTHLARLLPQILWRDAEPVVALDLPADPALPPTAPPTQRPLYRDGYAVDLVTATEDWGVRNVIGGIVPQLQQNGASKILVYAVRHGCLTRAVLGNYAGYDGEQLPALDGLRRQEIAEGTLRYRGRWLVIDEFTRAPIDAAFGGLLTTLGGQRSPLMVPAGDGRELAVPLPQDFRIIGTLNSFDRHFLNQISEAMKRRFTFIDVLPPGRELAAVEQAMVVYRALRALDAQGVVEAYSGDAGELLIDWEGILTISQDDTPDDVRLAQRYRLEVADAETAAALASFWRIFSAVRVYRQLGTAQAEAVCSALFAGQSIGLNWADALDSALADVLADQLQVLNRDEQRVLLAYLEHPNSAEEFAKQVKSILGQLPAPRQAAHLAQLRLTEQASSEPPIDDLNLAALSADQLGRVFDLSGPLTFAADGLFGRRLRAFAHERGL
jgi:5-methylcytosine-specific restriction enzyme B